jgi:hypothetical protein
MEEDHDIFVAVGNASTLHPLRTATQREERLIEKEEEAAIVTVLAEEGSGGREEVPKTPKLKVCLHYCSWVSIRSN